MPEASGNDDLILSVGLDLANLKIDAAKAVAALGAMSKAQAQKTADAIKGAKEEERYQQELAKATYHYYAVEARKAAKDRQAVITQTEAAIRKAVKESEKDAIEGYRIRRSEAKKADALFRQALTTAEKWALKQHELTKLYERGAIPLIKYNHAMADLNTKIAKAAALEARGGLIGVIDEWGRGLSRLPGAAGAAGGALSSLSGIAGFAVTGTMIAMTGAVLAAGAAALKLAFNYNKSVIEMERAARASGMNAIEFSRLQVAGQRYGFELRELADANLNLAEKLKNSQRAGSQEAIVFKALGIATVDAKGKVREVGDVFDEVTDIISVMASETEALAFAGALFGEDTAKKILPALRAMPHAFREAKEENDALGLSLSGKNLEAAHAQKKVADDLSLAWKQFTKSVSENIVVQETSGGLLWLLSESMAGWSMLLSGATTSTSTLAKEQFSLVDAIDQTIEMVDEEAKAGQRLLELEKERLAIEARKKAAADATARAKERLAEAERAAAAEVKRLGEAVTAESDSMFRAQKYVEALIRDGLSPLEMVIRENDAAIEILNADLQMGRIGVDQYALAIAQLETRFKEVKEQAKGTKDGIKEIAAEMAGLSDVLGSFGQIASQSGAGGIGSILSVAATVIETLKDSMASTLSQITAVAGGAVVGIQVLMGAFTALSSGAATGALADFMSMDFTRMGEQAAAALEELLDMLPALLLDLADDVVPALTAFAVNLLVATVNALPLLVSALPYIAMSLIDAIVQELPNLVVAIVKMAPAIVEALARGVVALVIGLVAAVLDAAGLDKAAEALRGAAGSVATGNSGYGYSSSSGGGGAPGFQGPSSGGGGGGTYNAGTGKGGSSYDVTDGQMTASSAGGSMGLAPGDRAVAYQPGGKNDLAAIGRQNLATLAGGFAALIAEIQGLRRDLARQGGRNWGGPTPARSYV